MSSPAHRHLMPAWIATACIALAFPTLIAYNVSPSATFFNQAAAFVGWGGFLLVIGLALSNRAWPRAGGSLALLGSMAILVLAALGASVWARVPWSLSLSNAGTMLPAILAIAVGACAARAGIGGGVFKAFCIGLVVAGLASSVIGLMQVFTPDAPDGTWIAGAAIPGRATGNLRQPNHLSSLLLWSIVAAVWLGEARVIYREVAALFVLVFIYVVVLSASRTGAVGMLTLFAWGLLDRRQSRSTRVLLMLAPVVYLAMWGGTTVWATHSHHLFGGQTRFGGGGDISSSRFAIWRNTLSLIAMHPWLGVGFGDFNFAWTLTPFPNRPVAFFDHTHDIVLNFAVELGIPLALLVLALMVHALWRALQNAVAEGRQSPEGTLMFQRAAFVVVVMVSVHSMLEYPLWYSYFLLPAAFAFGLCLERPVPAEVAEAASPGEDHGSVTRPYVLASMALMLAGTLAVWDYMRVVVIFDPPANAGSLESRIEGGQHSVLFAHHADYAAATVPEHPGTAIRAFDGASHYLLDTRLMMAWAKALDETGQTDKGRYVAARLKEFRNDASDEFFAPCAPGAAASAASASAPASSPTARPFQCEAPQRSYRFKDFR